MKDQEARDKAGANRTYINQLRNDVSLLFEQVASLQTALESLTAPGLSCVPEINLHCIQCGETFKQPLEVNELKVECGKCSKRRYANISDFNRTLKNKNRWC
jgi:protein-arginine kinase activator protein McsA